MSTKVYNKLVRDNMVGIYISDKSKNLSSDFKVRNLSQEEILEHLKTKLTEESNELTESYADNQKLQEEIADVLEVLDAIVYHKGFSKETIESIQKDKKEKRGGFEKGIYLESINYLE